VRNVGSDATARSTNSRSVDPLAVERHRLAAGRQDRHRRRAARQVVDDVGHRVEHVLAVVEHHEGLPVVQERDHAVARRHRAVVLRSGRGGDAPPDVTGRRRRRQDREIGERRAVAGRRLLARGRLDGDAGLAGAARTRDGHEPVIGDERAQLDDVRFATEERRSERWQGVVPTVDRGQRRELGRQLRVDELPDRRELVDALQPMLPQVDQLEVAAAPAVSSAVADDLPHRARRLVVEGVDRRLAQQDLAALASGHHPRRAVHLQPVVVAGAHLGFARVDPHADAELGVDRPDLALQRELRLAGRVDRGARRVEGGAEAVTPFGEHVATVAADDREHQRVVSLERRPHGQRLVVPQLGRPLDVGEQERHQSHGSGSRRPRARHVPGQGSSTSPHGKQSATWPPVWGPDTRSAAGGARHQVAPGGARPPVVPIEWVGRRVRRRGHSVGRHAVRRGAVTCSTSEGS
jgi:hypothetical protein